LGHYILTIIFFYVTLSRFDKMILIGYLNLARVGGFHMQGT